jgi:hypothetical protein
MLKCYKVNDTVIFRTLEWTIKIWFLKQFMISQPTTLETFASLTTTGKQDWLWAAAWLSWLMRYSFHSFVCNGEGLTRGIGRGEMHALLLVGSLISCGLVLQSNYCSP